MIVRIAGEGQYELPSNARDELDGLDDALVVAVDAGDELQFKERLGALLETVRARGSRLADDSLIASDVILPPPDTTLAEAAAEFTGEGLIPD